MQKAFKDGKINLGFTEIDCAVLKDGTRLITTRSMNKALGRSNTRSGKSALVEGIAPFLNVLNFKPFISNDLALSTLPIEFQTISGVKAYGYRAETLPQVCEVFLKARDAGVLIGRQIEHAATADLIIRSLAKVGIIALVDEATGYQEFRDKTALQALLDKYLSSEAAKWAKTFPDKFYLEIFRLKKWNPSKQIRHKPGVVAHITKDLVYKRLSPGIMDALEEKNPKDEEVGRRKFCHHQFLTKDYGVHHLKGHLFMLMKLMQCSNDWKDFIEKVDELLPICTTEDIEIIESSDTEIHPLRVTD